MIDISEQAPPCDHTRVLLAQRLAEIDAAIADLRRLRKTIVSAQQVNGAQSAARCAVIERA